MTHASDSERFIVELQVAAVGPEAVLASVCSEIDRHCTTLGFLLADGEGFRRDASHWLRTCRAAADGIAVLTRRRIFLEDLVGGVESPDYPPGDWGRAADRMLVAALGELLGPHAPQLVIQRAREQVTSDLEEVQELAALITDKTLALITGDVDGFPGELDARARVEGEIAELYARLRRIEGRMARIVHALEDLPALLEDIRIPAYSTDFPVAVGLALASAGDGGLAVVFASELGTVE